MKILKNRLAVISHKFLYEIGSIIGATTDKNESITIKAEQPSTPGLEKSVTQVNDRIQSAVKSNKITDEKIQELIKEALSDESTAENIANIGEVKNLMVLLDKQLHVGPTEQLSSEKYSEQKDYGGLEARNMMQIWEKSLPGSVKEIMKGGVSFENIPGKAFLGLSREDRVKTFVEQTNGGYKVDFHDNDSAFMAIGLGDLLPAAEAKYVKVDGIIGRFKKTSVYGHPKMGYEMSDGTYLGVRTGNIISLDVSSTEVEQFEGKAAANGIGFDNFDFSSEKTLEYTKSDGTKGKENAAGREVRTTQENFKNNFTKIQEKVETIGGKSEYIKIANSMASKYGLDPNLVKGVIMTESSWQTGSRSNKGAVGLMQVKSDALIDVNKRSSQKFTMDDLRDPKKGIEAGCIYLKWMMEVHNNDERLSLTAYNWGMGHVRKMRGEPRNEGLSSSEMISKIENKEAREYAAKVLGHRENYKNKKLTSRSSSHEQVHRNALSHKEAFSLVESMGISVQSSSGDFKNRFNPRATTVEGLMPETISGLRILSTYVQGLVIGGGTEVGHSGAKTVSQMKKRLKNGTLAGTNTHGGGRKIDFPRSAKQNYKLLDKVPGLKGLKMNDSRTISLKGQKIKFYRHAPDHLDVTFFA